MKDKMKPYAALTLLIALFAVAGSQAVGNPVPEDEDWVVAVKAKMIITVSGDEIKDGVIVIRNGKIEAVGKNVEFPREAEVIHAEDLVVMPGLVNPCTSLGSKMFRRSGVKANLKTADEFVPDPKVYDKLLEFGFTTFGVLPSGTGFPGQAMALNPKGENKKEWTLNDAAFVYATMTNPSREKSGFKKAFETAQKEIDKVKKAKEDWDKKQAEAKKKAEEEAKKKREAPKPKKEGEDKDKDKAVKEPPKKEAPTKKEAPKEFTPPPINPSYQPLVDLIRKKENTRALVALDQASDLIHYFEAEKGLEINRNFYLRNTGRFPRPLPGSDLFRITDQLGEKKASIVLNAVINAKTYTVHRINLPAMFTKAGCAVSLVPASDSQTEHANHLLRVSQLIKGGLKREDALKAMTLNPAGILGLETRIGSIEKGKDANLLFLTGDPFSALTRVDRVMINGKVVAKGRSIQ